jgi:hypothetical protein
MAHKTTSQKIRSAISPAADRIKVGGFLRQGYVEINLVGERLQSLVHGRKPPSSTIVLAGSGRSGTTWLQEILCTLPGVQPIFEPFHPCFNPEVRRLTGFDQQDPYLRSWYLRPYDEQPDWTALFAKVLTGCFRNYWTDYERKSFFPERFLIKDVRSNMYLGYIYQRFQPRIIYLLRHPCAASYSRLSAPQPWYANTNDLLSQPPLVEDYLEPWIDEIQKERDLLGAHAVWWAVENRVALNQINQFPHFLIYYEEMVLQPEQTINNLLQWLGYTYKLSNIQSNISRPSRMSHKNFHYKDKYGRLNRWQNSISKADCERVLTWANRFGLEMYNQLTLPKHLQTDDYCSE